MPDKEQPLIILLTGPNGAGKTTFRQNFLENNPAFSDFVSLNWDDETARLMQKDSNLNETTARVIAGKTIIQETKDCFTKHKNFIYETVAADKRHTRMIKTAKNAGYKIVSVFIGLSSPELSKLRVKHRVTNGGHDISSTDIESRYPKVMANFPDILNQSDTCFVIDNSGQNYKLILLKSDNFNITFSKFPTYLPKEQFDLTKEQQPNGSILIAGDEYLKKSTSEKQKLIQHLLEFFSTKNI